MTSITVILVYSFGTTFLSFLASNKKTFPFLPILPADRIQSVRPASCSSYSRSNTIYPHDSPTPLIRNRIVNSESRERGTDPYKIRSMQQPRHADRGYKHGTCPRSTRFHGTRNRAEPRWGRGGEGRDGDEKGSRYLAVDDDPAVLRGVVLGHVCQREDRAIAAVYAAHLSTSPSARCRNEEEAHGGDPDEGGDSG